MTAPDAAIFGHQREFWLGPDLAIGFGDIGVLDLRHVASNHGLITHVGEFPDVREQLCSDLALVTCPTPLLPVPEPGPPPSG